MHSYDFLTREREVAELHTITPEDVRCWFATHLDSASPQRRKLAVHVLPLVPGCAAAAPPPKLPVLPMQPQGHGTDCATAKQQDQERAAEGGSAAAPGTEAGNTREREAGVVEGSRVWLVPDLAAFKANRPLYPLPPAQLPPCS